MTVRYYASAFQSDNVAIHEFGYFVDVTAAAIADCWVAFDHVIERPATFSNIALSYDPDPTF